MIASAGDAVIDFVPAIAANGEDAFVPRVGGSGLNVAVALAQLGVRSALIAGVSTDLFGEMIVERLVAAGVDLGMLTRSDDESTLAFVKMDGDDARYAFYDEHSAGRRWRYEPSRVPIHTIDALHVGSVPLINEPSASAYEQLMSDARAHTAISFDPNCRPTLVSDVSGYRARMARFAAMTDIARFSEEDFAFLYPDADESRVASDLLAGNTCTVLITRGGDGASAYNRTGRVDVPSVAVDIVDTIGAGDTFQSAFLVALYEAGMLSRSALQTITLEQLEAAMRFAARAAAITCTRIGCEPPRRAEL